MVSSGASGTNGLVAAFVVGDKFEHLNSFDGRQVEHCRPDFTHMQFIQRPFMLHRQQMELVANDKAVGIIEDTDNHWRG